jgi:hypothetical protein
MVVPAGVAYDPMIICTRDLAAGRQVTRNGNVDLEDAVDFIRRAAGVRNRTRQFPEPDPYGRADMPEIEPRHLSISPPPVPNSTTVDPFTARLDGVFSEPSSLSAASPPFPLPSKVNRQRSHST